MTSTTQPMIPLRLKTSWGVGALGVAVLMNAVSFLILAYLITVVKMEPALAGAVVLVSKIFDAVSDPIMGQISDKSKFKSGRRRPYLFIGSFVSVIAFGLLFSMPVFDAQWAKAAYALPVLLLYTLGYTIFNVPYMAMSAEMTDDYEERTSLHGVRVIFVSIGSSIASAGAPLILELLGRDWDAYATVGLVLSAVIFAAMMTCWFGTRSARAIESTQTGHNLVAQVGLVARNKHFLVIALTKLLQLLAISSGAAVGLIFFMDYLDISLAYLALFGIVNTVITMLSVPILVKLAKSIGKRNTYILSAAITMSVGLSWTLVPPGLGAESTAVWPFLPDGVNNAEILGTLTWRFILLGFVIGGNVMMAMSMLMDSIEYDALKTGLRREGLYAAFYSFVEKFSSAFGPFLIGVILQFTGYDNSLQAGQAQSAEALDGILIGQSFMPAFFTGLSILALLLYRLNKDELNRVRAEAQPAAAE